MKIDKQVILDFLDARNQGERAGQVDANLPPQVDLDMAHHRTALERLDVDVEELRSVLSTRE